MDKGKPKKPAIKTTIIKRDAAGEVSEFLEQEIDAAALTQIENEQRERAAIQKAAAVVASTLKSAGDARLRQAKMRHAALTTARAEVERLRLAVVKSESGGDVDALAKAEAKAVRLEGEVANLDAADEAQASAAL